MEEFWMEGNRHQQSEPAGHRHGVKRETQTARRREEARLRKARTLLEDLEKQKGRLPPGEEVTGSICLLPFENSFFLANRGSKQNKVSPWGYVAWETDREVRKLCGATGAKRQSWAERKCPSNAGLDS